MSEKSEPSVVVEAEIVDNGTLKYAETSPAAAPPTPTPSPPRSPSSQTPKRDVEPSSDPAPPEPNPEIADPTNQSKNESAQPVVEKVQPSVEKSASKWSLFPKKSESRGTLLTNGNGESADDQSKPAKAPLQIQIGSKKKQPSSTLPSKITTPPSDDHADGQENGTPAKIAVLPKSPFMARLASKMKTTDAPNTPPANGSMMTRWMSRLKGPKAPEPSTQLEKAVASEEENKLSPHRSFGFSLARTPTLNKSKSKKQPPLMTRMLSKMSLKVQEPPKSSHDADNADAPDPADIILDDDDYAGRQQTSDNAEDAAVTNRPSFGPSLFRTKTTSRDMIKPPLMTRMLSNWKLNGKQAEKHSPQTKVVDPDVADEGHAAETAPNQTAVKPPFMARLASKFSSSPALKSVKEETSHEGDAKTPTRTKSVRFPPLSRLATNMGAKLGRSASTKSRGPATHIAPAVGDGEQDKEVSQPYNGSNASDKDANEAMSTLPRVATNKSKNSGTLSRSNSIWSTMKKIATVSRPSVDTNSLSRHSLGSWSHIQNEDASAPKTDVFGFPLVEDAESQIRSLASQRLVETTRLSIWNRNVEYSPYWVGDELACPEAVAKGLPEVRKVGMNLVYEFPDKLSLVDRVSHGLPHAWRGYVWYYLITSTSGLTSACSPEDATAFDLDLVKEFHENNDTANNISYAEEIIQDAEATATVYPNRIHKLKRVLCALSQRDDKTGYVGSMVHVAAMLLLVMDEERAYIALVHLYGKANHAAAVDLPSPDELRSWTPVTMRRTMSRLSIKSRPETPVSTASTKVEGRFAMNEYYGKGWPKFYEMCYVHDKLMALYAPMLKKKLDALTITSKQYAIFWFLTMFESCHQVPEAQTPIALHGQEQSQPIIPFRILIRIWDLLFLWGFASMPIISVALMKWHESMFKEMDGPKILGFLRGCGTGRTDSRWTHEREDEFFKSAVKIWSDANRGPWDGGLSVFAKTREDWMGEYAVQR
ncbi:hypothetical protein BJ741DRAFT_602655 [Chytriomyces cf. hyalinus JEL632]|nr:hypothetical protein BJ741DRAFT_602655 [Chytriomyces cf. hyalinus JEL632]